MSTKIKRRKLKGSRNVRSFKRRTTKTIRTDLSESKQQFYESITKNGRVYVTDHAVFRYLERVKGMDKSTIEEGGINLRNIKKRLITDKVKKMINVVGSGRFPHEECTLVVKDGVVVTIVND